MAYDAGASIPPTAMMQPPYPFPFCPSSLFNVVRGITAEKFMKLKRLVGKHYRFQT